MLLQVHPILKKNKTKSTNHCSASKYCVSMLLGNWLHLIHKEIGNYAVFTIDLVWLGNFREWPLAKGQDPEHVARWITGQLRVYYWVLYYIAVSTDWPRRSRRSAVRLMMYGWVTLPRATRDARHYDDMHYRPAACLLLVLYYILVSTDWPRWTTFVGDTFEDVRLGNAPASYPPRSPDSMATLHTIMAWQGILYLQDEKNKEREREEINYTFAINT